MQDLIFHRFEVESFKGINAQNPIVLDFTQANKKGQSITVLKGDQQTGKSSTIEALLYCFGYEFKFKKENLVNLQDKTINVNTEFAVEGVTYRVRATKSRFVLEKYVDAEKVWIGAGEPKSTLQKLVRVGFSPLFLKDVDGERQIKYLRETFSDEENNKKEEKILSALKEAATGYRDANREYKRIKAMLESDELYLNYEQNMARFQERISLNGQLDKLKRASAELQQFQNAELKLQNFEQQASEKRTRIEELREQLRLEEEALQQTEEKIAQAKIWISEHAHVREVHAAATAAYENINLQLVEQERWDRIVQNKGDMDQFSDMMNKFEAKKDQLRMDLKKVTEKYLPKIKGLELKLGDDLDDDQKGLFWNQKSLAQLSESELWDLFLQIWEQKDVKLVVIDNLTSLGTGAISRLNELSAQGIKIWGTEMKRNQSKIAISFTDKLK